MEVQHASIFNKCFHKDVWVVQKVRFDFYMKLDFIAFDIIIIYRPYSRMYFYLNVFCKNFQSFYVNILKAQKVGSFFVGKKHCKSSRTFRFLRPMLIFKREIKKIRKDDIFLKTLLFRNNHFPENILIFLKTLSRFS